MDLKKTRAHFPSCWKYHCGKHCLGTLTVQYQCQLVSDFQTSHGSVASRAWEQMLLPDAVPICNWTDIKVLDKTGQAVHGC